MTKVAHRFLSLLLLPSLSWLCAGQGSPQKPLAQMPASARHLIAITATGSQRFSQEAIAASTGLQLGTTVGEDDFKKAARRLGDAGAFTDIAYSFSYSAAGTKLEFKVTDAPKFVPAKFEDFVWFTDEELHRRIKEHVPLFNGELPLSGRMADEVSDVLQAMLVEKAIPGHVDYGREGKQDGPVEAIAYKVSDVLIRIRKIEFTGAADAEKSALEDAAARMTDRAYSRSRLNLLVQRDLLPILHERGYLKAAFGDPEPQAVQLPSGEAVEEGPKNQTVVDLVFPVTPGQPYKLKSLDWTGNHQFPTETLEKMVHVKTGQPANTVRLGNELKEVQKLYGTRGFITATVKADAEFDEAASTVAMHLEVKEGSAYHMGELEFRGLDNSLTAKLRDAWKLRPGDVYNADYLQEYLPAAHKLLPATLDWDVSSHVTANVRDKTVDVDLIYSVKAPK
jgi:outer membrane protein assembly factor BamA